MWPSSRFQRHLQEGLSASGKEEEEEDPYTTRLRPAIRKLVADTLTSTQARQQTRRLASQGRPCLC